VKPFNKSAAEKRKKEISPSNGRRKRLNVCSSASKSERSAAALEPGEDPDIAGIVPGPQPPPGENPDGTGILPGPASPSDEKV